VPLAGESAEAVCSRTADDDASDSGDARLMGANEKLEVEWVMEDPGAGLKESGSSLGPELSADCRVGEGASD
jgi:hypothetical protein